MHMHMFESLAKTMTVDAQTCVHEPSMHRDDLDCLFGSRMTRTGFRTSPKSFWPTMNTSMIGFLRHIMSRGSCPRVPIPFSTSQLVLRPMQNKLADALMT